ncbi:MAG TPA: DNA-binding response regulator [Mycobacterium sp.]|nr:DNA-binding response regulator [Mycobacterium sp.]
MPPPVAEHATHAVAVIDKHEAIHTAVQSWCEQARPRIRFVRGYFSAEHFLAEHPSRSASPVGVVICDVQTASGRADFTDVEGLVDVGYRVIVYTHTETDDIVMASVQHGAVTCLLKSEGKEHLINAIRAAHSDAPYIGPRMARAMRNDKTRGRPKLAPREKEVLIAWFRTDSKDDAARQLSIAPTTVRTILQRIRAKYAAVGRPATTKAALVARAIQDDIIGIDDL